MDAINVIPFIDIMLVLLAIVMATATFIAEGRLDIRVPEAASADDAQATSALVIAIDGAGNLFVDGSALSIDGLAARLDDVPPQMPIQLRVDETARFGTFVAVIDLLRARDLERLSITTRAP
jgi:biopolymer transport protein ExbD